MIIMRNFKSIYITVILGLIFTSCALDFEDANPPRPLDGPAGSAATPSGDAFVATDTNNDTWTYVPKGGQIVFDINIVDAPGLIKSADVVLSNSLQPEDLGTVSVSLGSAEGQAVGSLTVTYTAGDVAGDEDIKITINDGQEPAKSITFTYPTIRIADTDCFSNKLLLGFYSTVTSGFDGYNGVNFTDLQSEVELYFRSDNHPGKYRFSDGSFGLYGEQGFAGNFIHVIFCGDKVLSADEEFAVANGGSYTGTVGSDGVITITWSNAFGDSGTTVMTPIN